MKAFFDGIFIDEKKLNEAGIKYPIKLEYYKTIASEGNVEAKYGIEIIKTEYKNGKIYTEREIAENLTNNTQELDRILTTLRNNEVTPIAMQDILSDIFVKI